MSTRPPILEADETPIPGKEYVLTEAFMQHFEVVSDPYDVEVNESTGELVERKVRSGPMVIRGVFQYENKQNANKRIYPTGLWEAHCQESSDLMKRIKARRVIGEIEHPKDGVGTLKNAAILTTKLTLGKPDVDGARPVLGEAEVLDTPDGRIIRDLIRSNVKIGVSSRAVGSVNSQGIVEKKTFKPETWDVVGNPSTPGAFPELVNESKTAVVRTFRKNGNLNWKIEDNSGNVLEERTTRISGDRKMSTRATLELIRSSIRGPLSSQLTESTNLNELDETLHEASANLGTLAKEDDTLTETISQLQSQIRTRREQIMEAPTKAPAAPAPAKTNESKPKNTVEGLEALLREAHATLTQQELRISELTEQVNQLSETNEAVVATLSEQEETISEMESSIATQVAMIQRLTAETNEDEVDAVQEAIEEALENNPKLADVRSILERCQTTEEVENFVNSVSRHTPVGKLSEREDLPGRIAKLNENLKSDGSAASPDKNQKQPLTLESLDTSKSQSLSESKETTPASTNGRARISTKGVLSRMNPGLDFPTPRN